MYTRNNKVARGRKFKSAWRFYWARTWFAERGIYQGVGSRISLRDEERSFLSSRLALFEGILKENP